MLPPGSAIRLIVMIRWTGLAPWEFEFLFPGCLTSNSFLAFRLEGVGISRQTLVETLPFRGIDPRTSNPQHRVEGYQPSTQS